MGNVKARFSDRATDYVKYRPGYPPEVLSLLKTECGLKPGCVVADIGSGTGIFTKILLEHECIVFAIEPNAAMRQAAEESLGGYSTFVSIDGSAEDTPLSGGTIDIIVAAQAFHWFDPLTTRQEWIRILKPDGHVVLIWNERRIQGTPFLEAYEALIHRFGTDYAQVQHRNISSQSTVLTDFFKYKRVTFYNEQNFDFDGLLGRLSSASYIPTPQDPLYPQMVESLKNCFLTHARKGQVTIAYDTLVIYGLF